MDTTSIGSQIAHYTTFEVAENIIKSKQIWLSGIDRVNDPREYSDWNLVARLDQGGTYDHEVGESIREKLNKLKKFCKISCFSEDNDSEFDKSPPQRYVRLGCIGRCYANPVLWHHYADKHKGVCLVFDKQLLIDNLSNSAGTLPWLAESVEYARGKFARDLFSTEFNYNFHQGNDDSYAERFINERSKDLFFKKHFPWQAENEFRLFLYSPSEEPFRLAFGSALKKIVVSDLGKDDITPLLALARNSVSVSIKFYFEMIVSSSHMTMNFMISLEGLDLSPNNRAMTSMRFPLKWLKWRSRYANVIKRLSNER